MVLSAVTSTPLAIGLDAAPNILLLAIFPGLLALLLYYRALGHTPASRATLAELAFPLTAALVEDLTLIGGARAIECELSALERRRRRDRQRHTSSAAVPSWFSADDLVPTAFERAHRLI